MLKYVLITLVVMMGISPVSAETITIAGSTTVKKYMGLVAEAYMTQHPETSFDINGGGSTSGFGKVIDGRVNIGMMSRDLTDAESKAMSGFQHVVTGYDAVSPVVSDELHHQSGITSLSVDQFANIYRGKITNWKEVGGPDRSILLVDKEIHRGTRYVFASYILGDPLASVSPEAVVLEDNNDVRNIIIASDQAVAYISASYVEEHVLPLGVESHGQILRPDPKNIRDGSYPLSRKLYLIVPNSAADGVQNFVQFILSPEGQSIVEKAGYLAVQ